MAEAICTMATMRGAIVATPSAYFEKCLGNPVLRQLEKNTKVEKPLLVEAGRHG
jgi:uncharacterized protein YybS (DUF2232 family)